MKTISQSNAAKRLQKLVDAKALNKRSRAYDLVRQAINYKSKRIDTVWSSGLSWKYSSLIDETKHVSAVLDKIGIKYKLDNDAPRGGRTGEHLVLLTQIKPSKDFKSID